MNLKTLFTAALFVFLLSTVTRSQPQNTEAYIEGEVLVQLDKASGLSALQSRYGEYGLQLVQVVSARFNIFLLHFDKTKVSHSQVLKDLQMEKSVLNAQNNHYVELRGINDTIPDDPLFGDQWSLVNTGQNGGLPDADIDADQAWDITTGGTTALGDQIVIAIVDGGSDLNHEDLDLWKNEAEIPFNNIDDDTNGFVDDYDGWNAYEHNGIIPQHNHGVHVSGIAGAVGNNGKGVSGVNWHVKILPVAGSSGSSEATVVEALSYVYTVRERYDQTGGAEGAFVVADNCSFGIDQGNPEQYPIWEAMYDSLGQLGILSMGATANRAWDIDSVGDVPTGFTTDFMVAVTNTTKLDELYLSAGWGDTTIDLGAPGVNVKSLRVNNGYGNSTGTSMATPHVTGAAALILSAADSIFMVNYKNQPAEGALLIKSFILDGVDKKPSLLGKTVSGGRLNVFESINLLLNAPVLQVDNDTVYVIVGVNDTARDSILITNTGSQELQYSIATADQPDWISLSHDEGNLAQNESERLILDFDSEGLETGLYQYVVVIEGDRVFSKSIVVKMLVDTNSQDLQIDKDSVYIELGINSTGEDTILLTNTGFKELYFTASIPGQPDWISLSDSAGILAESEEKSLVLYFDTEGLISTGLYQIQLVVEEDSVFTKTVHVEMLVSNVGTDELTLTINPVSIFPNPFTNRVNFEIEVAKKCEVLLEVFDQKGQKVYTKRQNISSGNNQLFWESVQEAGGIYFYQISLDGQMLKTGKLVKK